MIGSVFRADGHGAARKLDKSVHSGGQSAFCKLMIKARKAAGLTQRELADRLHKPQSFVAKYEGGERRIDVVEFLTVCQAIGVDNERGHWA
jgi:predicted transcriptional regulator